MVANAAEQGGRLWRGLLELQGRLGGGGAGGLIRDVRGPGAMVRASALSSASTAMLPSVTAGVDMFPAVTAAGGR